MFPIPTRVHAALISRDSMVLELYYRNAGEREKEKGGKEREKRGKKKTKRKGRGQRRERSKGTKE